MNLSKVASFVFWSSPSPSKVLPTYFHGPVPETPKVPTHSIVSPFPSTFPQPAGQEFAVFGSVPPILEHRGREHSQRADVAEFLQERVVRSLRGDVELEIPVAGPAIHLLHQVVPAVP